MRIKFIQDIIDRLRNKIFALDEMVINSKRVSRIKECETIILGSSHAKCSFIPNEKMFNLGSASQDLYYSYNLYKKYNHINVKNIILTFSVFTPGDILIRSGLAGIAILFKLLHNIDYQYPEEARKKGLYRMEKRYLETIKKYNINKKNIEDFKSDFVPIGEIRVSKEEITKRALKHYKNNIRENNQIKYFKEILDITKKNNQNLIIVITPHEEAYRKVLPAKEELFKKVYEYTTNLQHVKIINLYDSEVFNITDFCDGDHLNIQGAEKMTKIIRRYLNEQ